MGYYIDTNGNYYEGDKADLHDVEVPQRPSQYSKWMNGAWVDDLAALQPILESAVQSYMDAQAKLKGYDNIVSACSYAAAPNAFQAEGISFLNWRAACWSYCYTLLAQVNAGTATVPTANQLIAGLPVRV